MMIVAMLAVWRAGAIFMPLEPSHPLDYRRMLLAEAGAACCLCAPEAPARPADGTRRLDVTLERASEPMESSFVPAPLVPEKTAYLLFTSGSTGKPKGVLVSHAAVAAYTSAVLERIDVPTQIGDAAPWRFAVVSSLAADLGYTCVFGALWTGGTLRILQQDEMRDPAAFAGAMAAAPVDVLKIVPTHLGALLDWPEPAAMLPRRRLVLGGEASHWSLIEKVWRLAPGCRVFNHYGPSETTVGATAVELTPSVRGQSPEGVPLGTALGHARIELRSVDGVTRADEGEILIGGEGVAIGYLDRPDDEAARFIADPAGPAGARLYRTGDRGRLSKDGLLLFLGRIDDEVKIRGHRVAPGAVAAKLREFPGVQDCAVLVDPNARGEPRLVAYVAGPRSLSETELRGWAAAHLPPAMVPDTVLRVDALPRTANGKIDRERLRASLPSPRPAAQEHDDAVAMLLQIWRDVLNAPEAGADDDFFALGGDSIMAIQIAGRARTAGLRFNAQLLFEHPTVRALLAVATRAAAAAGPAAEALPATPSPLSPVQRAFFELQQAKPQHWCLSAVLRLPGRPDAEAIRRALRAVIARHPALRLRFRPGADGLLQHLCEESDLGPTPVIVEDGLERAARQALEDALVADFGSSFDLARGPLLGAALLDRGAHEPPALLVVVHHLVFDAVSWSIFAEDLVAALDPLAPVPTSTAGFDAWCKTLERHARTLDGEATSWREIETQIRPILPRLATAADAGENRERHVVREAIHLPVALTADLKRAAAEAATGAGLHDVVLAALAVALTGRTGGPVVLDIEGHGRETIDPTVEIDRTIGWFTTHFPLALALEPSRDRRRLVEEVHRAWRALPGAGLGYGVLRYLRSSAGLDRDPEVSFNFLGTLDLGGSAEARFERFGSAAERDPDAPRRHLLVVEAFVTESALVIELQYARNVVGQDVILEIRDAMTEWLEQLAAREAPARVDQNLPTDLQLDDEEMRLLSERLGL
jgi:amino acid adenylation domain-containing protein/non-ribosomal peptide synthase protein (TIGR01720 family)